MLTVSGEGLSVHHVYDVAVEDELVELDHNAADRVQATYERVQHWGAAEHPIYGVNTGFGELVSMIIPARFKSELQSNLLRSHAAGCGPSFPTEVVRAVMLARLNNMMKGHSGASRQAVSLLQQFLNRRLHPVIPQQGSLGASGDLAPLSHMALPLIGEGLLEWKGEVRPAAEVLHEEGLTPLDLGYKEALALINGTSAMTGLASLAIVRAEGLIKLALMASADFVQCLGASMAAFDSRGHLLKNHSGQISVARVLRDLLTGSQLTRDHASIMQAIVTKRSEHPEADVVDSGIFLQNAYSLRAIPQIWGPVVDTWIFCRDIVERELNSCNDNPLFFDRPEETFHGANFHGQYIGMACDYLNIALTEIGVLAERQIDRLLDPHLNGTLPPFLAAHESSGLFCGFEGAQYLATSIASENLSIAGPSSIKSIPSNGSNQDVVSMGLIAARKSWQLCDNITSILTVHVACCHQASYFIGHEKFSPPLQEFHRMMTGVFPRYRDDVPIFEVLDRVRAFVDSDAASQYVGGLISLGAGHVGARQEAPAVSA
jgi:tyrosine 2,3-aminomutase